MNNLPLVSVIIATYNREESIKRAIESVFGQTYKNIELIVVDDGSIDGTKNVVRPYFDNPKFKYFFQDNQGPSSARNKGIRDFSAGEYIAILDSDDFWCDKNKLQKQVNFLEKNEDYALVGGGSIKIDREGMDVLKYLLPEKDEDIRSVILITNPIVNVSVLYRKDIWEKAGGYSKEFDGVEDWELWLKMGKFGKFYNFQEFFSRHSGHWGKDFSYLDKTRSKIEQLKMTIGARLKYRNDYPGFLKAFFLSWLSYFHYLIPFRRKLWPLLFRIRTILIGRSPYKYFKPDAGKNKM
jgi:glycosyltransferase involved in cell wall biosynthesis